jgi:ATP-dependent Clp protease ATP-binding subunit ClpA
LLGLAKEGLGTISSGGADQGLAAQVLGKFGLGVRTLRLAVEARIARGPDMITMGRLPLTPRANMVLDLAVEEAIKFKADEVGTEHILLGLLREKEGIAGQILDEHKVTYDKVLQLLGPDDGAVCCQSRQQLPTRPRRLIRNRQQCQPPMSSTASSSLTGRIV